MTEKQLTSHTDLERQRSAAQSSSYNHSPRSTISYGRQHINENDINSVVSVLRGDWLTQGPTITAFEDRLCRILGSSFCCAVSNGSAALHLAGKALGWKSGDVVFTTPITFLASASCALHSGAVIDFADIDYETYTLDPCALEERIERQKKAGQHPKAIVGVDYAGHPCHWSELRTLADQYDLKLINDNCHALGAQYEGQRDYASKYADITTLSFHPVKHITTGEGGAVLTNDEEIDSLIRQFRSHGIDRNFEIPDASDSSLSPVGMTQLGFNYRLSDIQCALGLSQLDRLDDFLLQRRTIAECYVERLKNISEIILPTSREEISHAFHLFAIQINFEILGKSRRRLFDEFAQNQIILQTHYQPVHLEPYFKNVFGFKLGDFPRAEKYASQTVSLPIYPGLNEENVHRVCDLLQDWVDTN